MTLLYLEGFEISNTIAELLGKYEFITSSGVGLTTTAGRFFGTAISIPIGAQFNFEKTLDAAVSTLIQGNGFNLDNVVDGGTIMRTLTGVSVECKLNVITTGVTTGDFFLQLEVGGGSGFTVTTTTEFDWDTWYEIEWKLTVGATGSYVVKVDGVTELTGSGVQMGKSATNFDKFSFGGHPDTGGHVWIDDIYVCDNAGSLRNDFLGTVSVEGLLPNAVGNSSGMTPLTGPNNYTEVDEADADGDASYNLTNVAGTTDTYGFQDVTNIAANNILGVMVLIAARITAVVSSAQIKEVTRPVATDYPGAAGKELTTSYRELGFVIEQNPETTADWTASEIDAAEFGAELDIWTP